MQLQCARACRALSLPTNKKKRKVKKRIIPAPSSATGLTYSPPHINKYIHTLVSS